MPLYNPTGEYTNPTTVVRKASDETVNNSDTLQNDDELIMAVAANQAYTFEIFLLFDSGATPSFKFGWSVPTGTTMLWKTTNIVSSKTNQTNDGGFIGEGVGTSVIGVIQGTIIVSSTAGNVVFRWAQITATASDTKVLENSSILYTKIT